MSASTPSLINSRISRLRTLMALDNIDATIIPQSDPHQSEYIADHWQLRRFLSGFTGSAGSLVVTRDEALLWTDSRYFIQAASQLSGTEIRLMKALPENPTIDRYLAGHLRPGSTVGINGLLFSHRYATSLAETLAANDIRLDMRFDPADRLWPDRPSLPLNPISIYPDSLAGESAASKLEWLRQLLTGANADSILISSLDEIAWLLNIRSRDIECNPVAIAYFYLTRAGYATLFVDEAKITEETVAYLDSLGIRTAPYTSIVEFASTATEPVIMVDPATTSALLMAALGSRALPSPSPVPLRKAIKNNVEADGFRNALLRDSIALVRAHRELEERFHAGERLDETSVCEIWHRHRSMQEYFFDESFGTIAGYGPNGAIVHYTPTPGEAATLGSDSLLLIDSGAQYLDGTTDITRTICLGTPTAEQRHHFTLVLKGNINLAMAVFPTGTRGSQLDIFAHQPLWREGLNYLHGTGHGVGHFLGVHEGPHQIRMNDIPTPLQAGMTVTDEPGLYLEGQYGIRCENMLLVVPAMSTPMGDFLKFETLTLFPFDRKLINPADLNDAELKWLNEYHDRVALTLAPHLSEEERRWLNGATAPIVRH
ncbi:MAG: aminopeptidase P family protein [Muribaculaceae bacterium]|nr:aminopeptidase P family protein [Muribaculaceae bacterium]